MRRTRTRIGLSAAALALALAISAESASASVTVSPTTINFGPQKVGTKSPAQQITVKGGFCGPDFGVPPQPGPCFPEATDVAVSGDFVIESNTCPAVLQSPNIQPATCSILVAFKPKGKGQKNGFARAQSSPSIVGTSLSGNGCKKKKKKGSKKKKLVCK